jgi:acyl-CoA synthetase (AMP-forming)/AMP-acid ligase II
LHTIPLFHANGWGVAHYLTLLGGKHVMMQGFDPAEVFRLIEQEGVHYCSLVPTMATALVNSAERLRYDSSSLRRITIGGSASSPTLVREVEETLGCTCYAGYGLTETAPVLSVSPMKSGLACGGERRFAVQAMTGYAIPGVELRVVDANDEDVARDGKAVGEIIARSDGVMKGYCSSLRPRPRPYAADGFIPVTWRPGTKTDTSSSSTARRTSSSVVERIFRRLSWRRQSLRILPSSRWLSFRCPTRNGGKCRKHLWC